MWYTAHIFNRVDYISLSKVRKSLNEYSPYKFNNNSHLAASLVVVVAFLEHLISSLFCTKIKRKTEQPRKPLPLVSEYDLAKALGLIFMLVDHRAYFSIPTLFGEVLSINQRRWCRIIGRGAAPMYFWVAGYANSYRFRWLTFFFAIFMITATENFNLNLVYTPFETIVEILAVNVVFKY